MKQQDDRIRVERIETAPFGTNAYIVVCTTTGDSVLVDAPGEADRIAGLLKGTNPKYILITHNHMDHTGALAHLVSTLNIAVAAHPSDSHNLPLCPELLLNDGDIVSFGEVELNVMHTPGHTPGSLCFQNGLYLISGDTLFPGGPGRTGSPSDLKQIIESIKEKIFVLPDEVRVYPGHGDPTVLKKEKEEFAVFSSRPHDPNLCGDVLWLSS